MKMVVSIPLDGFKSRGAGSYTPDFDPAMIIFKRKVHLQHQPESSTQDVGTVVDLHDHVILSLEAHGTSTILS